MAIRQAHDRLGTEENQILKTCGEQPRTIDNFLNSEFLLLNSQSRVKDFDFSRQIWFSIEKEAQRRS
jgi:hypothetical protein